jgi:hypothetical protein
MAATPDEGWDSARTQRELTADCDGVFELWREKWLGMAAMTDEAASIKLWGESGRCEESRRRMKAETAHEETEY